jgi:hypothetical protein
MADMVDAVLHMTKDGRDYISMTDSYSVSTYAYTVLNSSKDPEMLTLCADLLRYGAYAQQFKKYRTDCLADREMTELHKSYLSDMQAVTFGNNNSYREDCAEPKVTWVGKTLDLGSKIGLLYVADFNDYEGSMEDISLRISFVNMDGLLETVVLEEPRPYGNSDTRFAFTFDGLLAAELRSIVSAAVFEGNTQISQTLVYSADTYGRGQTGLLGELCKALFAYSYTALAYFR